MAFAKSLTAAPHAAVLIDEAYFEFCGVTALGLIREYPNLFVSRTFSKVYGMAAMRCGCLFSRAENVRWMHKAQSPYSVNMLAALAARAAVRDGEYVANYVKEILAARELACAGLRAVWASGSIRAARTSCCFTRAIGPFPFATPCAKKACSFAIAATKLTGCVRVTIGTRAQIERFLAELETLWKA